MEKKLVRSAVVMVGPDKHIEFVVGHPTGEMGEVVAITYNEYSVQIFFREKGETETSTPKKLVDRPMRYYSQYPFMVQDIIE